MSRWRTDEATRHSRPGGRPPRAARGWRRTLGLAEDPLALEAPGRRPRPEGDGAAGVAREHGDGLVRGQVIVRGLVPAHLADTGGHTDARGRFCEVEQSAAGCTRLRHGGAWRATERCRGGRGGARPGANRGDGGGAGAGGGRRAGSLRAPRGGRRLRGAVGGGRGASCGGARLRLGVWVDRRGMGRARGRRRERVLESGSQPGAASDARIQESCGASPRAAGRAHRRRGRWA